MKENNIIEETLIKNEEVSIIDIEKTIFNVFHYIIKYKHLKYKTLTTNILKITTDYRFIFTRDNKISSYSLIDKELDNINEYEAISKKIILASYIMNKNEKIVLQQLLYNGLEPSKIAEKLNMSIYGIKNIYYSCMLKLALKLDIEIKNEQQLNNKIEKFYRNTKYKNKILFKDF